MRWIVESWQVSEILRAGERAAREGNPRRFGRALERSLDAELVRSLEQETGIAIAEHADAIFRAWGGRGDDALLSAIRAHVHQVGFSLELAAAEDEDDYDEEDDGWPETGEHPHVERLRGRGTAMLVGGVVVSIFAVVTLLFSMALAVAFVLPGVWLVIAGSSRRNRARRLRDLEGLALSNVKLSIADVGRELETSTTGARALIREALGQGIIEGRLDLGEDVFLSAVADPRFGERSIRCRACGASSAVVRGPGIVPRCPYCRAAMKR